MATELVAKSDNLLFCVKVGKSACAVSKWCSNTTQPDLISLDRIAKLLDVVVNDLLINTEK